MIAVTELLALGSRISDVNTLAYLAAFGGGVVSFLSPCVLPLLPGYLSMVTGLDLADIQQTSRANVRRVLGTTSLFIAGFGAVFIALGLSATRFGQTLREYQDELTRISGAFMLAMALFLLGSLFLRAPWLYQEKRHQPELGKYGNAAPLVAGAAFGFGWSPCLGPILGSILTIAANQDRALAGGTLLAVYALGLGLPFLLCGLGLARLSGALNFVKRHYTALIATSAVIMGGFGILLLFNQLSRLSSELVRFLNDANLSWLVQLG